MELVVAVVRADQKLRANERLDSVGMAAIKAAAPAALGKVLSGLGTSLTVRLPHLTIETPELIEVRIPVILIKERLEYQLGIAANLSPNLFRVTLRGEWSI